MAVEVLVRLTDGHKGDGRHAGAIVCVKQVPHAGWGSMERPPTYGLITITDRDASSPELQGLLGWRVPIRRFTQETKDQLDMGRSVPMPWSVFSKGFKGTG